MTTALRWAHGPTPLSLHDLRDFTKRATVDVVNGHHEVRIDTARRWYRLLRRDDHVDLWLISWATDQAAELHDHAGSLGALSVVRGSLTEWSWTGAGGLGQRHLPAGCDAGFPLGHVHDVVNTGGVPAVSVHAYSPPLTAMSYYAVEAGALRRTRSVLTTSEAPV